MIDKLPFLDMMFVYQIEPGGQTEQAPPSAVFQLRPEDMHGFRFLTISVAPRPVLFSVLFYELQSFIWLSLSASTRFCETFDLFHNFNLVDAHEFDKRISETNSKDLLSQSVGSMFVLFIYQYLIVLIP